MNDDKTELYNKYRFFRSELRSPLSVITGYMSMVEMILREDTPDIDKALEFIKRARQGATSSMKMIDTFVETGEINHHSPPRKKRKTIKKRGRRRNP